MAGRKKRKVKLLAEIMNGDVRATTEDGNERLELQTWSDLPVELLESIISHLTLADNIRASAVCKRWHNVAISVRLVNQSPWLMSFPKSSNLYEFYDPSERKTYTLELPELYGSRVCYAKDGWLLLYKLRNDNLFFFNPFTRDMIELPRIKLAYQIIAFSCAPTSTNCVIFTIKQMGPTTVAICTCHPGASEWAIVNYETRFAFVSSVWDKVVFTSGFFYCLSLTCWLGIYNPLRRSWNVLRVPPPRCPVNFLAKSWWKGKFMTEHNGDVLVIYTSHTENPIIYKLDQSKLAWEEMVTLDGVTLFASFLSSYSGTVLPGIMRNSVYFPKVRSFDKRCISYSLDEGRYYPRKQQYDWREQDPFEKIWIEPPQNASSLI